MNKTDLLIEQIIQDTNYDIRSDGTIWSNITNKTVGHINKTGYLNFGYKFNRIAIHRVIYRKFKGELDPLLTINHKDGNKQNNLPDNLEQISTQDNTQHAVDNNLILKGSQRQNSKLTEYDIKIIKSMFGIYSLNTIAKQFNVHKNTIKSIKDGRSWSHII